MPRTKLDPKYWQLFFREELRQYRQADIAKALGCSQQTVSNKIKKLNFTLMELAKMQKELGVDIRKVVDLF